MVTDIASRRVDIVNSKSAVPILDSAPSRLDLASTRRPENNDRSAKLSFDTTATACTVGHRLWVMGGSVEREIDPSFRGFDFVDSILSVSG